MYFRKRAQTEDNSLYKFDKDQICEINICNEMKNC